MVRPMKCPYCNNMVSVSSHWKETTCPNCKNVFEIGLEVFELSEEEQKKEQVKALADIHKKEQEAAMRKAETAKRLRQVFHLPEPDPHRHIKFEEDESEKTELPKNNKKFVVIAGIAGGVIVFAIMVLILISALNKKLHTEEVVVTENQAEITETVNTTESQMYDSEWNDGYAIDSNSEDGRFKIDLQSSDTGEQKDVKVRPDVVDDITESSDKTVSENKVPAASDTGSTSSSSGESSSAIQKEAGSAYSANTPTASDDSEVISDMILNGVN